MLIVRITDKFCKTDGLRDARRVVLNHSDIDSTVGHIRPSPFRNRLSMGVVQAVN
jgi:hypothetical protein